VPTKCPVTLATRRAIGAAQRAGTLTDADGAAVALAIGLAAQFDKSESPTEAAVVGAQLRQMLARLRLDTASRPAEMISDTFSELMAELAR
jgi:hypothetical protein